MNGILRKTENYIITSWIHEPDIRARTIFTAYRSSQTLLQKADALSTTCFLLGYEKGMELIQSMDGVEAIFITDDEKVHKIGI